jgi:CheY-like chemotaxis protein
MVAAARPAEVLVADDESIARQVLQFYIGSFGYTVQAVKDGDELLAACRKAADSVKLAILDARMPGPRPLELYRSIREIRPDLPVFFCSGAGADDPELRRVTKFGVHLLEKPFSRSDLQQAILKVLKRTGVPSM